DGPDRGPVREHTLREARAASKVDHPAVVHVYDVVEEDGRQWIVMQLIKAPSLAELLERNGPCTPQQTARIGLQLLGALTAAHAEGIVHRDVKPSNVLIDGEQAVLTDFGIAAIDGEATPFDDEVVVGSPSYIAPERLRGEPATPASDLWALAATLYATVEGRPPFSRDSALAIMSAVATGEPDPLSRAGILAPLLTRMLHRDPARRPDAAHVERELTRLATLGEHLDDRAITTTGPIDHDTTAIRPAPPTDGSPG
ncbi:MAG TPA: serine/threonine-protein kinase, partial [Actinomycetes bacterium]|nr:serine/threonine-protein kinase [Actinomycetes bacterium]